MTQNGTSRYSAAARLDRLPVSGVHRRLFGMVAGGLFIDNFDIYVAGAALAFLLQAKWTSLALNASFVSATFFGMLIGTIAAGIAADRFGRKLTFQINLGIFGIGSLTCALAPDMHLLIAARFICGIGLGAELVVGYSTLAEFIPPAKRGRWQALMSMTSSFGLVSATVLSYLLAPIFGWRILFILPGVAALIILYLRKSIPESPRWLELQGRCSEADTIASAFEESVRKEYVSLPSPAQTEVRQAASIFNRKFLRPLILGTVLQVVMFTALYGLVNWIPTFLTKQGMSLSQSLGHTVFMSLGGPVGAFLAQITADKFGRRRSIICGSIVAAACALLFGQVSSPWAAKPVGFATFTTTFYLLATIQAVYLPELFPTEVRMRCNALCVGIARISTIFTPFGIVKLFEYGGLTGVVTTIAGLFLVQAAVMAWIGAETSGRSIDDVESADSKDNALIQPDKFA